MREIEIKFLNKVCSATQVYGIYGIRDLDYSEMSFERMVKREGDL